MNEKFDFVEFWAKEFKKNPKKYRPILNKFIDSQIFLAQKQLRKLEPDKLIEIFNIKNKKVIQMIERNKRFSLNK